MVTTINDFQLRSGGGGGSDAETGPTNTALLSSFYQAGDTNLSAAWNRMLTAMADNTSPVYRSNHVVLGKYPGNATGIWPHDTPVQLPSNFTLENGKIEWVNTDTSVVYKRQRGMFEGIGATTSPAVNITADIADGDTTLTLATTSGMAVGGYVYISCDNTADQTTGMFPIIYTFAKITSISGNVIGINTQFKWPVNRTQILAADAGATFTVTYYEGDDVPKNILIKDVEIFDSGVYVEHSPRATTNPEQPDYVIGPFYFQYCDSIQIKRCRGSSLTCPLVQIREFLDCLVEDCYLYFPRAIAAGEGYTCAMSRGSRGRQIRLGGYETRHICDFTSTWDGLAQDCWDDTPASGSASSDRVSFLCHARYDADIKWVRCRGLRLGTTAGFVFGGWINGMTYDQCHLRAVNGRGAIGLSHFNRCYIEEMGTYIGERIIIEDSYIFAGHGYYRLENRPNFVPKDTNGLEFRGVSRVRGGNVEYFNSFTIGPNCQYKNGSTSTLLLSEITDVKYIVLDGYIERRRFIITGDIKSVTVPDTAHFWTDLETTSGGCINIRDLTVPEFDFICHGKFESAYTGSGFARPFIVEKNTGDDFTVNCNISGTKFVGEWDEVARFVETGVTVKGSICNNIFEGLTAINLNTDKTTGSRVQWPNTVKVAHNVYGVDSYNWDNIDHTWTQSVSITLAPNEVKGLVLTRPQWFDLSETYHLTGALTAGYATSVAVLTVWDNSSNLNCKFWNHSNSTVNVTDTMILKAAIN